jgi:hypothetical protein
MKTRRTPKWVGTTHGLRRSVLSQCRDRDKAGLHARQGRNIRRDKANRAVFKIETPRIFL